ncbi:MAG: ATPase [Candidatus Omnitrophica bacterium]|nr:ATPase [Candidatus Omnitrophota bacterium]
MLAIKQNKKQPSRGSGLVVADAVRSPGKRARSSAPKAASALEGSAVTTPAQYVSTSGEQLAQWDKLAALGQLLANVAHEINNPVGFVSNNLEVLRNYVDVYLKMLSLTVKLRESVERKAWAEADAVAAEIRRYEESVNLDYMIEDADQLLRQSQEGIGRIGKLVGDLRAFAREDSCRKDELVAVEHILDTVLGMIRADLQGGIDVRKLYGNTPAVSCNKNKLGQVFMNLLMNARQAMRAKGCIEVRTYALDGNVCVEISDNGCGIAEEHLDRIFQPFFTTKPSGEGTGLGLSISRDIVTQHGGRIAVASQVGKGSAFTVTLPIPKGTQGIRTN